MNYLHYSHIENYKRMPLLKLKKLRECIEKIIERIEASSERREIDIASEHSGRADLIHTVHPIYGVSGDKNRGRWNQVESIYCCQERCPKCPHGPYWYSYRTNKRRGTLVVTFRGSPVLSPDSLESLKRDVRSPVAAFEIRVIDSDPR